MDENLLNRRRQSADHSATQSEDDDSGNFEASICNTIEKAFQACEYKKPISSNEVSHRLHSLKCLFNFRVSFVTVLHGDRI